MKPAEPNMVISNLVMSHKSCPVSKYVWQNRENKEPNVSIFKQNPRRDEFIDCLHRFGSTG